MASIRSLAKCIGLSPPGELSLVRHFYGYRTGTFGHVDLALDLRQLTFDEVKTDPTTPGRLSLLQQLKLLKGPHIHLNLIRVAREDFTTTDRQEIDVAVEVTRKIYARAGLGVGRVLQSSISKADADGYASIDTECEAFDLIDEWDAPSDGIDVFFVRSLDFGKAGATPEKDPDGTIVEIVGNVSSGIALAHELVHYLGVVDHSSVETNLMFSKIGAPPYDLSDGQLAVVMAHAEVREGCP
jgi:hypothetical protein